MTSPHIVWFRQDLRLHDQPALSAAAEAGPVLTVYILDDETPGDWRMGGAQRWWLHHSLEALTKDLKALGSRLILRRGRAVEVLQALSKETGAEAIHAIRHYEPWWRRAEDELGDRLCLYDGNHLARPELVTTGSGKPFRIYSAFWKGLQGHMPPEHPLDPPEAMTAPDQWPASDKLADWDLLPTKPDWSTGFDTDWTPGEAAARERIADFDKMPWREGAEAEADLKAWQTGRTGYPIVDAGMRQLWTTGWMHNRVRMITASFLIKHLLIDWREGERWFWDCLVDADYGNNSVNWQWVAGTGIDANMFGRIMAPLSQSEKFDAGDYIREWVPELKDLSDAAIHDPDDAGCRPKDYPAKIIGHREGRERALAAGKSVRG